MSNRRVRLDESGSVIDLEGSLSQLSRQNGKLERMSAKVGTSADTPQFRDMLTSERENTTHLTKQLVGHLKEQRIRGPIVSQVEREYKRFTEIVTMIDTKQKQQLVSEAQRKHNPLADEIIREEEAAGRSMTNSYVAKQLAEDLEFIEYNVDEIAQRHQQIRAIETDITEMASMWKDLQCLVDEQQVNIDIIESNIDKTKSNVESAHKELEQAAHYQAKSRKRACCTLMILIIIVAVIVLVVFGVKGNL